MPSGNEATVYRLSVEPAPSRPSHYLTKILGSFKFRNSTGHKIRCSNDIHCIKYARIRVRILPYSRIFYAVIGYFSENIFKAFKH